MKNVLNEVINSQTRAPPKIYYRKYVTDVSVSTRPIFKPITKLATTESVVLEIEDLKYKSANKKRRGTSAKPIRPGTQIDESLRRRPGSFNLNDLD